MPRQKKSTGTNEVASSYESIATKCVRLHAAGKSYPIHVVKVDADTFRLVDPTTIDTKTGEAQVLAVNNLALTAFSPTKFLTSVEDQAFELVTTAVHDKVVNGGLQLASLATYANELKVGTDMLLAYLTGQVGNGSVVLDATGKFVAK